MYLNKLKFIRLFFNVDRSSAKSIRAVVWWGQIVMDCLGICLFDLFSEPQKSKQADANPDHLVATAQSIMDTANQEYWSQI